MHNTPAEVIALISISVLAISLSAFIFWGMLGGIPCQS